MEAISKARLDRIAPLFSGWDETLIWSCLQGCMGSAWADCADAPRSAQIVTAGFAFYAGVPNPELAAHLPDLNVPGYLLIPQDDAWAALLQQSWRNAVQITRYAVKKEPDVFDRERLREYARSLPAGFRIEPVGDTLYHALNAEEWSRDLCGQFPTAAEFQSRGVGMAVLEGDRPVAGASSYTIYHGGIEIEIDTRPDYRERGLATACGAALILTCLDRGLYPSWDAHDLRSLSLARKFGYHPDRPYLTYVIDFRNK